ncbi:MAG: hypothetical protein R3C40_05540 [Parvularculaceae bacterium]
MSRISGWSSVSFMNVGAARQAKDLSDTDQLALQLPIAAPSLTRASYIVSDSNRHAVDTLVRWRDANEPFLAICGAPKSGKTHLATILLEDGEAVCRHVNDKMLEHDAASSAPLMLIDGVETLDDPRRLLAAVESVRARTRAAGSGRPASRRTGPAVCATCARGLRRWREYRWKSLTRRF